MLIDRRTAILGIASCAAVASAEPIQNSQTKPQKDPQDQKTPASPSTPATLPAERVLGIGGLFFRSKDPKALAAWYEANLGIDPVPTDAKHSTWQQAAGPTAFSPFPMDSKYIGPPDHAFMLNFRVRSLDAMVAQLQKAGIEVKVDPKRYAIGRFAHLHDPEGNQIELWQPATPA